MSTNEPMTDGRLAEARAALNEDTSQWGGEYGLDLLAEVERLRALTTVDDAKIERVARELACLDPGEAWPATRRRRDEEYRTAMREWAQGVIDLVVDPYEQGEA